MAGEIKVNTEQVEQIATRIESLNKKLNEELENSKMTIKGLDDTWDGEASAETISSYDEFANKYFNTYEETVASYVAFLRNAVAQGYFETEVANVNLGGAFK